MKTTLAYELQLLLKQLPDIINKYESKNSAFTQSTKLWITSCEKLLTKYNKPQVSELAGLRAIIIAAERGNFESSFVVNAKMSKRKNASAIAAFCLNSGQDILQSLLKPLLAKGEEAKDLMKQILAVANQTGLLDQYLSTESLEINQLHFLWKSLQAKEDIRAGLNRVLTLISYNCAINIMKEILDEWSYCIQRDDKINLIPK